MKMGDFIILGKDNNGLQNMEPCLVKVTKDLRAEHFSYPKEYVSKYMIHRERYVTSLLNMAFRHADSKPITLTDPIFIHIIETHTLLPDLLPEFSKFMLNLMVEQFGDKILVKPKLAQVPVKDAELWLHEFANVAFKEPEKLGFIRFNV